MELSLTTVVCLLEFGNLKFMRFFHAVAVVYCVPFFIVLDALSWAAGVFAIFGRSDFHQI